MHIHADKTSPTVNTVDPQIVNSDGMRLMNKRPEAILQRKLQEKANESKRVNQLKAYQDMADSRILNTDSNQPIQLKTKIITQKDQTYNYGKGSVKVGEVMEVGLDPSDMKQGQAAALNNKQDEMMDTVRATWGIKGGDLVKGHLWNDNLGGSALNENLYPITRAANSDHLGYVENKAKEYIWEKKTPIYYKVEVDAIPDISQNKADFDCEIRQWDPATDVIGKLLFGPITIESDLKNVGAYNEAYDTYTGNLSDRQKRPKKPKWATIPKTKVGELSKKEALERANQ
jgi:hypothetical protein